MAKTPTHYKAENYNAVVAERDAALQEVERHAKDNERMQALLAKVDGAKIIDLLQQVDDWMQVSHQQESEIERLEARLVSLLEGMEQVIAAHRSMEAGECPDPQGAESREATT